MFDDFTTQIQSDELAEIIGWNDAMEVGVMKASQRPMG